MLRSCLISPSVSLCWTFFGNFWQSKLVIGKSSYRDHLLQFWPAWCTLGIVRGRSFSEWFIGTKIVVCLFSYSPWYDNARIYQLKAVMYSLLSISEEQKAHFNDEDAQNLHIFWQPQVVITRWTSLSHFMHFFFNESIISSRYTSFCSGSESFNEPD